MAAPKKAQQLQLFQFINSLDTAHLLHGFTEIIDELILRDVVRSLNNPTGDYADYLVSRCLGLQFDHPSHRGNIATNSGGKRFLVKARRLTKYNKSRQLSVIRHIDQVPFDYLLAILFNHHFDVLEAWQIPLEVALEYGTQSQKNNGLYLTAGGVLLNDKRIRDIRKRLLLEGI